MRICMVLLALAALAPQVSGQFGSIGKAVKDTLKDAAKQQQGKVPKANPAPPTGTQAPAAQPAGQANASKAEPLWPNIAVDPEVVKKQQEIVRADCERLKKGGHALNCDCVVNGYPDARLRLLSEEIRYLDGRQKRACEVDPVACARERAPFEWITSKDAQMKYPTSEGHPNAAKGGPPRAVDANFLGRVYLAGLDKKCVDNNAARENAYKSCMEQWSFMAPPVKPGTSTKAYCSCIADSSSPNPVLECSK